MKSNRRLYAAIAAVLGGQAGVVSAADQDASATVGSGEIAQIVVTAQRRSESSQDVPIALQALTGETLKQLNVTTFEDYVKYLPNVTFAGGGPGQNNIYMRGLATSTNAIQGSTSLGNTAASNTGDPALGFALSSATKTLYVAEGGFGLQSVAAE